MKTILVIPTYNEKDSLPELISRLDKLNLNLDYLFVDDNSPDGTADFIISQQAERANIFLLSRPGKLGLGTAYLEGFRFALDNNYEAIVQMDADLSHDPDYLASLLAVLEPGGLVIGSRYIAGGGVENWAFYRRLISKGGSFYARTVLGLKIRDLTGGFNVWHRDALNSLDLATIKSEGYSFQIEMKHRAAERGVLIKESPIVFKERFEGESKMSNKIILEAMLRVWLMLLNSRRGQVLSRFIKFCVVGLAGMLTDMLVMAYFVESHLLNIYLANCVSFCVAVTVTFTLNKYWTFSDRSSSGATKYFQFFAVSLGGLAWGLLLLRLFVGYWGWWYIYAKLLITVIVSFWNFLVNNLWTFRSRPVEN